MCHVLYVLKLHAPACVCAHVCVQALCSDMTQVSITDLILFWETGGRKMYF